MSLEAEEAAVAAGLMCCASCGKAEVDDVKLKKCACGLVKYCSVDCQKNHRPQHKKACKKRLAELRDKSLFTMPDESHEGDCPICCLPLPINVRSTFMSCCSKRICNGCNYTNQIREEKEGLYPKCAFCREPMPKSLEEGNKRIMKRIKENNDPAAMAQMGHMRKGEGDYKIAFDYLTKAAELGDAGAHYGLSWMYWKGGGVEKNKKKAIYHTEEAAIGGHPVARHNLGCEERSNGRFERARKHFIIAANLGFEESLKWLRTLYANGHARKEDYADALCAYQAAVDATKSADREKAEAFLRNNS
jgi:hypothetical protein